MKHILSSSGFTKEEIQHWFDLASELKTSYKTEYLKNKILGTLFFEPSTRTRWSFVAAMYRLGGNVLSMESAGISSSDKKGESLADTFMTCSQYADCLVVRHPGENLISAASSASSVPIINGGDGSNEHPTQALLDLYTINKRFLDLSQITVLFTGDLQCSRTIRSLATLLERYDAKVICSQNTEEINQLLHQIDVLYMTRFQKERTTYRDYPDFVLTNSLANSMKKDAIIMHPLPRNHELSTEVDENPRAVYREQMKNGLWIRMSLLMSLMEFHTKLRSGYGLALKMGDFVI